MKFHIAVICAFFSFATLAADYSCILSVNPPGTEGEMGTLAEVEGRPGVFYTTVLGYQAAVVETSKETSTKLELLIEGQEGKTVFGAFDKRQLDDELFDNAIQLEYYDEEYFVSLSCYKK